MSWNRKKMINEVSNLSISSLGMVSALAWNEAFISLFKQYPLLKIYGPWIYAILITMLTVFLVGLINNYKTYHEDNDYKSIKYHNS